MSKPDTIPVPIPRKRPTVTDEEMRDLLRLGRKHSALKAKIVALSTLADELKLSMAKTAAKHGLESVPLPTGNLSYVAAGESKKLSRVKLIDLGVDIDLLERAMVSSPRKAHWVISAPGKKKDEEGEE